MKYVVVANPAKSASRWSATDQPVRHYKDCLDRLTVESFDRGRALEAINGYKNLPMCFQFICPKGQVAGLISFFMLQVLLGVVGCN